jgi:hypothetical protein
MLCHEVFLAGKTATHASVGSLLFVVCCGPALMWAGWFLVGLFLLALLELCLLFFS